MQSTSYRTTLQKKHSVNIVAIYKLSYVCKKSLEYNNLIFPKYNRYKLGIYKKIKRGGPSKNLHDMSTANQENIQKKIEKK